MRIDTYGNAENAPILCIPGLFFTGKCFQKIAVHMPEYFFVCLTLNGHDDSNDPFCTLEEEVEKAIHLLQQSHMTTFQAAIGMSLGTLFAVELARSPSLTIEKLFLDGAVNFFRTPIPSVEAASMKMIFSHLMKSNRSYDNFFSKEWTCELTTCRKNMTPISRDHICHTLADYTLPRGLHQPMCYLFGSREMNITAHKYIIRRRYPNATILVQKGYGHLGFADSQPEAYAKLLRRFLIDDL